jgi:hypothetical protein
LVAFFLAGFFLVAFFLAARFLVTRFFAALFLVAFFFFLATFFAAFFLVAFFLAMINSPRARNTSTIAASLDELQPGDQSAQFTVHLEFDATIVQSLLKK